MKLNNEVINTIQKFLRGMDWAESKDFQGERLSMFLDGVRCALWEKGILFKLIQEERDCYKHIFCVVVSQYADPTSCWSEKRELCKVYGNSVEYYNED